MLFFVFFGFAAAALYAVGRVGSHLVEANVLGLLAEALTAEVEVVLADQTGPVLADSAIKLIAFRQPLFPTMTNVFESRRISLQIK